FKHHRYTCITFFTLSTSTTSSLPPSLSLCLSLPLSLPPSLSLSPRSEEHTSELQSHLNLVCRLLLEKMRVWGWLCTLAVRVAVVSRCRVCVVRMCVCAVHFVYVSVSGCVCVCVCVFFCFFLQARPPCVSSLLPHPASFSL